jgi:hypothetical protein
VSVILLSASLASLDEVVPLCEACEDLDAEEELVEVLSGTLSVVRVIVTASNSGFIIYSQSTLMELRMPPSRQEVKIMLRIVNCIALAMSRLTGVISIPKNITIIEETNPCEKIENEISIFFGRVLLASDIIIGIIVAEPTIVTATSIGMLNPSRATYAAPKRPE